MAALTKLDVINAMLATKGIARLSASDTSHPSYISANAKFEAVDTDFQGRGWWYNSRQTTLLQDAGGEVFYPANYMHVDPAEIDKEYVMSGDRLQLYDQTNETFVISADVKVNIVEHVPFERTPPTVRAYIYAQCRYEWFLDEDGDVVKLREYKEATGIAWAFMNREHLKNADTNQLRGSHGLWYSGGGRRLNRVVARQPT